ncbi:hypothetical protein [Actinophytocola xanthii]|uniref:DUF916 domain-containing protein n=1 Tax=Actinophytocola xanthii TaxID=1912961 RepID=A0A1Q8CLE2_9PSEU|nr:hypothetical protein [Actinophytocola xanthii]OLF15182.1 hypothetical protein BU204_23255 [Actinophytocola xanthii]
MIPAPNGTGTARRLLALACSLSLVTGWTTAAAEPPPPSTSTSYNTRPADFSLAITPARLVVGPADTDTDRHVEVINRGSAPLDVLVQERDFVGGTDGSLVFREDAPYSASAWVSASPASFRLQPGTARTVTARVAVPDDAEPGDHAVALVFLVPAKATGPENVRINRAIAAPLYIAVPGASDDSAIISGLAAPGFVTGGPVELTATMRNTGTVHRDFRGAAGLTVDAAGTARAFPDFTVMRGSTRVVRTTWDPPLLCVCHPAVSITNADGSVRTVTVRVVVLPVYLLLAVLAAAVAVLWVRRRRSRKIRADA